MKFLPFFAFVYKSKKVTNILQKFYGMMIASDEKWRHFFFFLHEVEKWYADIREKNLF